MCKELKTPCKENTFYQKLKAIPELKFPEPSDQVKCGDCLNLKEKTDKATTSAERLLYQQEHTAHVKFVDIERKAYYERMEICKTSEGRKKLIIADGMDQTKTNMPHVHQKNKTTEGKQLNTHVFGVTIHGNGTRIFIDYNQLPHDSNYVINAIMIALKEKIKSLGPDLYIQLDNTTGQNKNQFVHGFFYLTVHLKIFRYVEINGLPVGHTHEDIDRKFGELSRELYKHSAKTLVDLANLIEKINTEEGKMKVLYPRFSGRQAMAHPLSRQDVRCHNSELFQIPHAE